MLQSEVFRSFLQTIVGRLLGRSCPSSLESGLPHRVGDDEDLARFLTQSRHFSSNGVKPVAFVPNPKDKAKSVYRHGAEPEDRLWDIGLKRLEGAKLYGAAVVKAGKVRAAELEVEADEPPPRHANLVGWPWYEGDPQREKSEQRQLAILVAQQATLLLRK